MHYINMVAIRYKQVGAPCKRNFDKTIIPIHDANYHFFLTYLATTIMLVNCVSAVVKLEQRHVYNLFTRIKVRFFERGSTNDV